MSGNMHGLRRPTNRGARYPAVENTPDVTTRDAAVAPPIQMPQPTVDERQRSALAADLREHAVDTNRLSQLIASAATDIKPVLLERDRSLDARLNAWCSLHGYDRHDSDTHRILAAQAAFAILLKATLYEWYYQRGVVPELSDNIRAAFQLADQRVDSDVFEEDVLDEVVWAAEDLDLQELIAARDRLLASTQPAVDIWTLYEAVLAGDHSETLGQFRTPEAFARLMRLWATRDHDTVLDPGMGAASLSTPTHPDWEVDTDPTYVDGVDRSPLAALMGAVAQTVAGQSHNVHVTDFLAVSPADLNRDVDAVVCNPPYTRHQALPAEYKAARNTAAEALTGLEIPRTSPLYAYFYYHLRQFLDVGDRAAVLTAHHFFTRDYGEPLKQFLVREFDVNAFLMTDPNDDSIFSNAATTGVVAFLEATDDTADTVTRFIRVDEDPGVHTLLDAVRNGEQGDTAWGFINCVEQTHLEPAQKWHFFDPVDVETAMLTAFSDLAEIRRGLQTGDNDFFCLSQAAVESWEIDTQFLSRLVPKPRDVDGYDIYAADWSEYSEQGRATWLLYHLDCLDDVPKTTYDREVGRADWRATELQTESPPAVGAYLRHGLTDHESLPTRKTVHDRSPWYRVERGEPAPILIPPMTRSGFRAIYNATDARHTNSYYGVYPESTIDTPARKALLAYLNSNFVDEVVAGHKRTYAGGLDKVEPGDVADLPVIDPRTLPDDVVATLAECFDALRQAARRDADESRVLARIDSVLQRVLY